MKKIIPLMMVLLLLFNLTACRGAAGSEASSGSETSSGSASSTGTPSSSDHPELADKASPKATSPVSSSKPEQKRDEKILIAYFSRTGNTEKIATLIQKRVGGDLFKINTVTPYSNDYNAVLDEATKEQRENARPALSSSVHNMDDYQVVFIGYPIWWGDTPMAVLTFLESYDFKGKTVVPFCTYDSSGEGRSFKSVKSSASGATVPDGFGIAASKVGNASDKVAQWLNGLNIKGG